MAVPAPTTPDDMLEQAVLMREEQLEGMVTKENPEGPRSQVTLNINGKIVEVKDQPDEEKHAVARAAVNRRAEEHDKQVFNVAKFKLDNMSVVEAVDHIASLAPGDQQIYLQAEAAGKKRKEIFEVFGKPEKE